MHKINVLCMVDDDEMIHFLMKRMIDKTQLVGETKFFSNGLSAIEFLKSLSAEGEKLPELILLDLNMPVMDGWEFLKEFEAVQEQLEKEIAIYIVSSSIAADDIYKAKSCKYVQDYIVKPVTKDKLSEIFSHF